ncbi:PREDICTED: uncharacterized protein LOC105567297 [Vollenhovia emeryi]|uniref:uncharacterized protein LOC105567297 n=1 Tax=Vollenhovia emeryi TaxID=411798 RepID=UPI0005F53142|nr:PREDICTED: uncharacterized protein LOC105567297 [Vollenhovia emeryi]
MEAKQGESLLVCGTSREMWTRLSAIHEQRSATSKIMLLQQFHEHKMDASGSVIDHVSKVQNMASHLRDVGEPMSDMAIMAKIIGSLPPRYSAFRTAWESAAVDSQTMDILTERLIREESRLSVDDNIASALSAVSVKGSGTKKNQGQGKKASKKDVECFVCRKKGHYARECRQKRKKTRDRDGEKSSAVSAFVTVAENAGARASNVKCVTLSGRDRQKLMELDVGDVWLTDSGASRHVTYRRDWFAASIPQRMMVIPSLSETMERAMCEVSGQCLYPNVSAVNGQTLGSKTCYTRRV